MVRYRTRGRLGVGTASVAAILAITAMVAPSAGAQAEKILVCHGTSSEKNPFEVILVDDNSTQLEGHQAHADDGDDFIFGPDEEFIDIGGGQQLDRECNVSAIPTTTTTPPTTTPPTTVVDPVVDPVADPVADPVEATAVADPLPRTGTTTGPLVGLGVILLAAGTAMAISRRKAITSA